MSTKTATNLTEDQRCALVEAQDRLSQASKAFNAFMSLLIGENNPNIIDPEELFWLLHPIQAEMTASLDALRPLEDVMSPTH
jgi:hypothetical protein